MRAITLGILISFHLQAGLAQQTNDQHHSESFKSLRDDTIRNEIASFSMAGSSMRGAGSLPHGDLTEIPLKKCSDKFAYFEKGNLYASEIIVSMHANIGDQQDRINKIMYIHYKFGFELPDSAVSDIINPKFCDKYTRKGKPVASNCKVFRSEDKKRVYIYMLNGEGKDACEVTWVIQRHQYLTRIIDRVGSF